MTRDELAALETAATPGPWILIPGARNIWQDGPDGLHLIVSAPGQPALLTLDTAALIVAARNVLPELLRRLDLAEQALAAIETGLLPCRECGDAHVPRPQPPPTADTWAAADGHAYRVIAPDEAARAALAAIRAPLDPPKET
jgi:hypothetical protein